LIVTLIQFLNILSPTNYLTLSIESRPLTLVNFLNWISNFLATNSIFHHNSKTGKAWPKAWSPSFFYSIAWLYVKALNVNIVWRQKVVKEWTSNWVDSKKVKGTEMKWIKQKKKLPSSSTFLITKAKLTQKSVACLESWQKKGPVPIHLCFIFCFSLSLSFFLSLSLSIVLLSIVWWPILKITRDSNPESVDPGDWKFTLQNSAL